MKLPSAVDTNVSFKDFMKQLKNEGYRKLGSGLYAHVFAKKGVEGVIKVGNLDDRLWHEDGYVAFLRMIDPSNPLYPEIHSIQRYNVRTKGKRYPADRYYVVHMERLIDSESTSWKKQEEALEALGIDDIYDLEVKKRYLPKFKSKWFKEAYSALHKLWRTYSDDLHEGNVMWRKRDKGYQMVITDPATVSFSYMNKRNW